MHRTTPRTEFGDEAARYAFERGIPLTVLAQEAGVPYESLRSVMYGRAPGATLIQTVRDYMSRNPALVVPSDASSIPS